MRCLRCGKKGIFLKVNRNGHCKDCEDAVRKEEAERLKEETRKHREELEKRFKKQNSNEASQLTKKQATTVCCLVSCVNDYLDNLKKLSYDNFDFGLTKSELVEMGFVLDKIWENRYFAETVKLVSEPDNPNDPDAIRVEIEGLQVGYVPQWQCDEIGELAEEGRIKEATIDITGGRYKYVDVDYSDSGREIYSLLEGEDPYEIMLNIKLKEK